MSNLTKTEHGEILVVKFEDSQFLDESYCHQIGRELSAMADNFTGNTILLNFANVKFLASAMIGQLVTLRNKCKNAKIELAVCDINENVTEAIKLMRLDQIFKTFDCESEAVKMLDSAEG